MQLQYSTVSKDHSGLYIMIFEVDIGEAIQDVAGARTKKTLGTSEFGEYTRHEERLHHTQDWRSFLCDDVTY